MPLSCRFFLIFNNFEVGLLIGDEPLASMLKYLQRMVSASFLMSRQFNNLGRTAGRRVLYSRLNLVPEKQWDSQHGEIKLSNLSFQKYFLMPL